MSSRAAINYSTRTIKIYASAFDAQARADIEAHLADTNNPHEVDKADVGLALVDNTSDATKPVSGPQAVAMALLAPLDSPALTGLPTAPTAPLGTITTQLATAEFVQAAVNASIPADLSDDLAAHLADTDNPHDVAAADVGLGLVANLAPADLPVSTATQLAINAAVAGIGAGTIADDLAAHVADNDNPHSVDAADVGLHLVDNTADVDKPVSTATQAAINAAVAGVGAGTIADDLAAHLADLENPHSVDATDVGLGAVDNTADLDKPVSTATQLAINAAVAGVGAGTIADDLAAHVANTSNPHSVDAADVGLALVNNTPDASKPVSSPQQAAINVASAAAAAAQADVDGHQANVSNPHSVTKSQVGLGAVANLAPLDLPVSTATQLAINAAVAGLDDVESGLALHLADTANPHSVDKADVGLGNVANLAPAAMPISDATQIALNLKAPLLSPALTGLPTAPTAPPLTNTTQLATTAYADAAASAILLELPPLESAITAAQADADQALADAAAAQAAADAAQADADAALIAGAEADDAAADAALVAQVPSRPGDAVAIYGETKTGPADAVVPIDPSWVAVSSAGSVVRVTAATADDPQTVATATAYPVEPGRIYEVRWRVQRQVNPVDPLNDSVTCGLAWLTNTKASNGSTTVDNIPLVVADGVQERRALVGIAPPATTVPGYTAPAGTIYFRPFVDCHGGEAHTTDAITIDVLDVTAALTSSAHVAGNVLAPTSGSTVALTTLQPAYINNPDTLAALTIKLPPVTGPALVEIGFRRPVTLLTMQDAAGAAVPDAADNAYGPGAAQVYRYLNPATGWVYWK